MPWLKSPIAGVAQLVERQLPKLNVEGSNPFARFEERHTAVLSFLRPTSSQRKDVKISIAY